MKRRIITQEVELTEEEFVAHRKKVILKRLEETIAEEFQRKQLFIVYCRAIDSDDEELMKECTQQETDIMRARNMLDAAKRLEEKCMQWFAENIEDSE
jgi:hypothetical protein